MTKVMRVVASAGPSDSHIVDGVMSESWSYIDADTQHLTHNIHRYSGKFIPQIAARAISLLTSQNELVLDPYCGSGTTLVEAALLGRHAVGVDLNPLAVLIARTKVTPLPLALLSSLRQELTHTLAPFVASRNIALFDHLSDTSDLAAVVKRDPRVNDEWYQKWFQRNVLEELVIIDNAINRLTDARCQNVARVAFSDILRKSSNAHSGYPNVMFDKNVPERPKPVKPFLKALDLACEMVATLERSGAQWENICVQHGNATSLPLDDSSVDAVVSHPPYIGSIPYAEYGQLSLKWLGIDPKCLDKELTGGRRQAPDVVKRFQKDYFRMMIEASRVLRPGRHMFLMVGNPVVKGNIISLDKITVNLAECAGMQLVVRTTRTGVNRRANKMGEEHLLLFKKIAQPPTGIVRKSIVKRSRKVKDLTSTRSHPRK